MLLALAAATSIVTAIPGTATAQARGTQAQPAGTADERADLRQRMAETDSRIGEAHVNRAISRTRASELRRKLMTTRQSYARTTRAQGFVSAAESATYNRALDAIDAKLHRQ